MQQIRNGTKIQTGTGTYHPSIEYDTLTSMRLITLEQIVVIQNWSICMTHTTNCQ